MEFVFTLDKIKDIAEKFVALIGNCTAITFSGELGAGKTTFINEVCKKLGVSEIVSSPTFALIREYRGGNNRVIYHIDLYRIKSAEEAKDAGIEDCIMSNELCFIEWPEKAQELFPDKTIRASLFITSGNQRKLVVELPQ
jgi:tRNA threonylcarbamoyladenosine biosynthesis protein TsaE